MNFTSTDDFLIRAAFNFGCDDEEIARSLRCPPEAIHDRRMSLKLYRPHELRALQHDLNPKIDAPKALPANLRSDLAFKRAMLNAIKNKTEHIKIGVYKAKSKQWGLPRRLFTASPIRSMCGSPAAQCGEIGE